MRYYRKVNVPAFIPLDAANHYPSSVVGSRNKQRAQLHHRGVPLPPAVIIPSATLTAIAQHDASLSATLMTPPVGWEERRQLARRIKKLSVPTTFTHQLYELYQAHLQEKPVILVSDQANDQANPLYVQGEANIIESMLGVWAETIVSTTGTPHLPPIITIEQRPNPVIAGIATTHHPFTHAKVCQIHACWGAYATTSSQSHSTFTVDPRTQVVVHREVRPQSHQLQFDPTQDGFVKVSRAKKDLQKAPLTDSQLITLASHIHLLKQTQLEQLKVQWLFDGNTFYITDWQPLPLTGEPRQSADEQAFTLFGRGQAVQAGYILARCQQVTIPQDVAQFEVGDIAILKTLTPQLAPIITKAAGLIIESPLTSPSFFSTIHQFAIPTISQLPHATRLTSGQTVLMKAARGEVYQLSHLSPTSTHPTPTTPPKPSVTKLFVSSAYPHDLDLLPRHIIDGAHVSIPQIINHLELPSGLSTHPQPAPHLLDHAMSYITRYPHAQHQSEWPAHKNLPVSDTSAQLWIQLADQLDAAPPEQPSSFEQALIQKLNDSNKLEPTLRLNLIINQPRTPATLQAYLAALIPPIQSRQFHWWLAITTPQQLWDIVPYLLKPLTGIIFDLPQLRRSFLGIPANQPELMAAYQHETGPLTAAVVRLIHQIRTHQPQNSNRDYFQLAFLTDHPDADLVEQAVKNSVQSLIVPPTFAEKTKQSIIDAEHALLCQPLPIF